MVVNGFGVKADDPRLVQESSHDDTIGSREKGIQQHFGPVVLCSLFLHDVRGRLFLVTS